jgi:2,3-bisphosphoglycerate-independent phosphoglycerate mutase
MDFDFLKKLLKSSDSKMVLLIMDGLGGLPDKPGGLTELESARTPNLDRLAAEGVTGLHQPIGPGIAPGSGPAHLGVFGYDPVKFLVGRGALSAVGVDFDLRPDDVAARGNFCTLDASGKITDRRAGRISTEKNEEICKLLRGIKLKGAELFVETEKEHRFLIVLRGTGLSGEVADTDPHFEGKPALEPRALTPAAEKTSAILKDFVAQAVKVLAPHSPANGLILRGFDKRPNWPPMSEVYGVRAAAVAAYPMYRGLAKLVGMQALPVHDGVEEQFDAVRKAWKDFDFFYVHIKKTDSYGEDGNFEAKKKLIEEVDRCMGRLTDLKPDSLVVTGDHSTPAVMKSHSWHPVPTLLWGKLCRPDTVTEFGERACMAGGLGPRLAAVDILPLMLATANRLDKYGA